MEDITISTDIKDGITKSMIVAIISCIIGLCLFLKQADNLIYCKENQQDGQK